MNDVRLEVSKNFRNASECLRDRYAARFVVITHPGLDLRRRDPDPMRNYKDSVLNTRSVPYDPVYSGRNTSVEGFAHVQHAKRSTILPHTDDVGSAGLMGDDPRFRTIRIH
jgi:hypothetical protein